MHNFRGIDQFIAQIDQGLRTFVLRNTHSNRANPAESISGPTLNRDDTKLAGRLMRVNHAGEIAAQGLYQGQSMTARESITRDAMYQAAKEEQDHLAWCQKRLDELDTAPSLIAPLWYLGSVMIGASAGLAGDRWSLGFVVETEKQVEAHLTDHLERLPETDLRSRAILQQMQADEQKHAQNAEALGGTALPTPISKIMRLTAKIMTTGAYWI